MIPPTPSATHPSPAVRRTGQGSSLTILTGTLPLEFCISSGRGRVVLVRLKVSCLRLAVPHAPCPLGMSQMLPVSPALKEPCSSLCDALPRERQTGRALRGSAGEDPGAVLILLFKRHG